MSDKNDDLLNSEIKQSPTVGEEYAYLERGGFSSEKFKIELRGLPKFYGIAELKKLINNKLNLNVSKIKSPRKGSHWLYACFQNDADRDKAIETLNGYQWKSKTLIAHKADPAPDPLVRKRKLEDDKLIKAKRERDDGVSQEERLKDATIPYWKISYEEQLELKQNEIKQLMSKLDNDLWINNKSLRPMIEERRKQHGLSFELSTIRGSPKTEGYRNKCEFTVGTDEESGKPTVGFRLGSYAGGTVGVASVNSLIHISDRMKKAVLLFEEYVHLSNLPPYNPADYTGYWRCLTVRESMTNNEIMMIVAMYAQEMSEDELSTIKEKLVEHITRDSSNEYNIQSIYIHFISKKRDSESARNRVLHLWGKTHIIDSILGLQFRISPESFFQINTLGAEILYHSAIEMCEPCKESTVLDICCGIGTIGLSFSKHCKSVLGLEILEEAVKDAKVNAELNNITNCDFFTGKAEDIMSAVMVRALTDDIIAIVDPPRAGLHSRAIKHLRNNNKLKRLVYISCSPASAMKNFVDLTRPSSKTLRGAPFLPVKAVPVDMFPHTKHLELAILFERSEETDNTLSDSASKEEIPSSSSP